VLPISIQERIMRALFCAGVLLLSATAAVAQSGAQPAAKRQSSETALLDEKARVRECMKTWDRSTHMTKREWEETCRRVASERIKYLRDQGYGADRKKAPARTKPSQM
jgi:hypothetical protein